jgi:hypothetical protein
VRKDKSQSKEYPPGGPTWEPDGGYVDITDRDRILARANEVADKAREKAADERKSGSEARKDASEARKKFLRRAGNLGGGSAGGGGMNPTDIEKVPGKRQLKMKAGGKVSASKRADGCAIRGKTRA